MSDYTNLLRELLEGHYILDAPSKTRRVGKHFEIIIAIGNDEVAYLTLSEEAYNDLYKGK